MSASIRLACAVFALSVAPISWSLGSVEAGAALSSTCMACHGPNGNSTNPQWPSLAGQNAAYIEHQLHLFHDAKRTGKTGDPSASMMMPMAKPLTEQNMADVAAYYSQQTPVGLEADPSYWQAGQKLYRNGDRTRGIPACAACHGPAGRGNPTSGYPALRAQHAEYIIRQLNAYNDDGRYAKDEHGASFGGDYDAIMHTIASRLSDEDMRNVASYIQGMR